MTDDMLQWAQQPAATPGVGEGAGGDLISGAQAPPAPPDPRGKKVRRRPNKGRIKRTDRNPSPSEPPWEKLRALGIPHTPYLKNLPTTPPNWRRGVEYLRWQKAVFAMWGHTCHLCGHGEAYTADHLIPLSEWNNQPYDPALARPAHGVRQPDGTEGCPTCGLKCNSSRGNKAYAIHIRDYQPPIVL